MNIPHRKAFLSYARRDLNTALAPALCDETFEAIRCEVNAALGGSDFSFWKDTRDLRLGHDWRNHLHGALAECDFLVLLVSPSLVRSENCLEEFEAFRDRLGVDNLDGFIMPILHREVEIDAPQFTDAHKAFYRQIRKFQRDDWQALQGASDEEKRAEYVATAQGIAKAITGLNSAKSVPPPAPACASPIPQNAEHVAVVSGYYDQPSQDQNTILADVSFVSPAYIQTDHGQIVFRIRQAIMQTKFKHAKITARNTDFEGQGWAGPVAHVQQIGSNRYHHTLLIKPTGSELQGGVFAPVGEAGLVRLVDIEPTDDDVPPLVSGYVTIDRPVVEIIPSENAQSSDEEQAKMKKRLIGILFEKLGLEKSEIEGPE